MQPKENIDLYYHEYRNLNYSTEYSIAIRGVNIEFPLKHSKDYWHRFTTPSCMSTHHNTSECGPEPIENLVIKVEHVSHQNFTVSLKWKEPAFKPDFYQVEIRDIDPIRNSNGSFRIYKFKIEQNKTSIDIEDIEIVGNEMRIALEAHRNNFMVEYFETVIVPHQPSDDNIFFNLFIIVIVFVSCLIILLCKIQISKMNDANKPMESMDLDLIKTITNHSMLQVIADLTRDETMEIERENITLLNKLGEGAFGFVKKAALDKNGMKHQVAVKMLKGKPEKKLQNKLG